MTSLETITSIDLGRSVYDSNDTRILSAAFEKAWVFVESDPALEALEAPKRRSELARCLMELIKLGETNPTSLANAGIAMLRNKKIRRQKLRGAGAATSRVRERSGG
jgi:hypothetical protein